MAELPNLHAYQSELQSTKLYFEITFSWLCTKTGYLWNLFSTFHLFPYSKIALSTSGNLSTSFSE